MKKAWPFLLIALILVITLLGLILFNYQVDRRNLRWEVKEEKPRLVEKSGLENHLRDVLFLNEIYRNYHDFSSQRQPLINKYGVDLSSAAVMRGRAKTSKDLLEARGKKIVIGLLEVGNLVQEKNLDVLTLTISTNKDIDIKAFEVDQEISPLKNRREYEPENLKDPAPRFIFLGKTARNQGRETLDIELRNYSVKQRSFFRNLVLSITGTAGEELSLKIYEISLKSHQSRIDAFYPSVNYFKSREQWLRSLFIPADSSIAYLIHAEKPFFFDGCLGAFPEETPLYEIKANGKSLLTRQGSPDLPHFCVEITPQKGEARLEISVKSKKKGYAQGILGNAAVFYKEPPPRNVIFHLIDSLRGDYGGNEEAEQLFEKDFAGGAVFKNAYANATWTGDSLPVIFSGKYKFSLVDRTQDHPNLSDDEFLLSEYLKARGYTIAAFIGNSFLVKDNAAQGFDAVFLCWGKGQEMPLFPSEEEYQAFKYGKMARYLRDFTDRNRHKKLFLFIHTLEPHDPYELPKTRRRYSRDKGTELLKSVSGKFKDQLSHPTPKQIAALKALYKDEVLAAYEFFKKINKMLSARDIINKHSLQLLSADHGERFFEHGSWLHAEPDVYNEVLRVPLMLTGPGIKPGHYHENVQSADIFPTIMDWLGDPKGKEMVGDSLLRLINNDTHSKHFQDRIIYSDGAKHPFLYSYLIGSIKVIVNGDRNEVYDLAKDPGETTNLAGREEFTKMILEARTFWKKFKKNSGKKKLTLSEEELNRLKSLGYLD